MIYITNFLAFFFDYIINRKIIKYRQKYYLRELKKIDKERAYKNIYEEDKRLFLLFVCIPFIGEMVLSLILYSIFYHAAFVDKGIKQKKGLKENNKENNDDSNILKIEDVSIKRICGYVILNQKFIEKEEVTRCSESYCFFRYIANCCCYCFECFTLILMSFRECIKNTFCYICNLSGACFCDCCSGTSCCCCDSDSFGHKETEFCLCYQEKRKLEWFNDYINSKVQRELVFVVFLIAFIQSFTIGLEVIYEEKIENNINQFNITLPLVFSFLSYIGGSVLLYIGFFPCINKFENDDCCGKIIQEFKKITIINLFKEISFAILKGAILFIIFANAISSFYFSIRYFVDKYSSLFEKQDICYPIFWNKYTVFMLYFYCLKQDEEKEMISNSSIISVYLYILEQIIIGIKKLLSLKGLIILQIIFSSIYVLFLPIIILALLYLLFAQLISFICCCDK